MDPLYDACIYNKYDLVKNLLDNNSNVNCYIKNTTPLILACRGHNYNLVKLLLDYNANIDTEEPICQNTPLNSLYDPDKDYHIFKLLLDYKANINTQDSYGLTPLHKACNDSSIKIVKLLINNNADINIKSKSNSTPFNLIKGENSVKIAKYLIKNKADVNNIDNNQHYNLLHMACLTNNYELADYLINEVKMDINICSHNYSPYEIAKRFNHEKILKLFN